MTAEGVGREPAEGSYGGPCPCGCGTSMWQGKPLGDHPHVDPGDGRKECLTCGKWVHLVIHSCKGVPVTMPARLRAAGAAGAAFSVERESEHPDSEWMWACARCNHTGWSLLSEAGARREAERHQADAHPDARDRSGVVNADR